MALVCADVPHEDWPDFVGHIPWQERHESARARQVMQAVSAHLSWQDHFVSPSMVPVMQAMALYYGQQRSAANARERQHQDACWPVFDAADGLSAESYSVEDMVNMFDVLGAARRAGHALPPLVQAARKQCKANETAGERQARLVKACRQSPSAPKAFAKGERSWGASPFISKKAVPEAVRREPVRPRPLSAAPPLPPPRPKPVVAPLPLSLLQVLALTKVSAALLDQPLEQISIDTLGVLRAVFDDDQTDERFLEPQVMQAMLRLLDYLLGSHVLAEVFAVPERPSDSRLRKLMTRCHPDKARVEAQAQANGLTDLMTSVRKLLAHGQAGPALGLCYAQRYNPKAASFFAASMGNP